MAEKTKLGLIGAGSMASTYHYPSLAEFPDVELAGLCDLVEDKRQALASRFGIQRQYSDYRKMIDEVRPDAAYILMPPHHLFDIAIYCLRRGIHLFIEKPPGVTTFQTESMARCAAEHGCVTMVGFNRRHDPLINQALQSAKETGRVIQVQASFFKKESASYYDGSVDAATSDAIHAIDTIRYMAGGEVEQVLATVSQNDSPVPNGWNALVVFDNGVLGILQSNWSVGGRVHAFEVHSIGYSAYVEQLTSLYEVTGGSRKRRTAPEVMDEAEAADARKLNGFYQQAREFMDCIHQRRQPSNSFADAAKTMSLVDRIRGGVKIIHG